MTKIKICGLRREEDISFVNEVQADFAGFILTSRFWRYVEPSVVKKLRSNLNDKTQVVGVTVDEDVSYVASLINDGTIDIAQLHGSEDEEYISNLRKLTDGKAKITKVFIVNEEEDNHRNSSV